MIMKKLTKKEIAAGKTVKMPEKLFNDFISVLESGKVKQGEGALFDGYGYCCLGVLQAVATGGKCEAGSDSWDGRMEFCAVPSIEWLRKTGIQFKGRDNRDGLDPVLTTDVDNYTQTASDLNDGGLPFKEIAKLFKERTVIY